MDSHSPCVGFVARDQIDTVAAPSHLQMHICCDRPAALAPPAAGRAINHRRWVAAAAFPMPCYSYHPAKMCAMPNEPRNPVEELQVEEPLYRLPSLADMVAASECWGLIRPGGGPIGSRLAPTAQNCEPLLFNLQRPLRPLRPPAGRANAAVDSMATTTANPTSLVSPAGALPPPPPPPLPLPLHAAAYPTAADTSLS